jgi:hypothetical protein
MKKTMSLLLMSLIGLVGTLAWAGSAREDTVERMQNPWMSSNRSCQRPTRASLRKY